VKENMNSLQEGRKNGHGNQNRGNTMNMHTKTTQTAGELCDFINKQHIKPIAITEGVKGFTVFFYKAF